MDHGRQAGAEAALFNGEGQKGTGGHRREGDALFNGMHGEAVFNGMHGHDNDDAAGGLMTELRENDRAAAAAGGAKGEGQPQNRLPRMAHEPGRAQPPSLKRQAGRRSINQGQQQQADSMQQARKLDAMTQGRDGWDSGGGGGGGGGDDDDEQYSRSSVTHVLFVGFAVLAVVLLNWHSFTHVAAKWTAEQSDVRVREVL